MLNKIRTLIRDEEGATAIEYGLMAALIAAVIVAAVASLGETVRTTFETIDSKLSAGTGT